ncbi:MAG: RDD family protein [Promethearchaeota archaeon]
MSYQPAGPIKRLIAFLIDEAIEFILVIAMTWPLAVFGYGPIEILPILLENLLQAPRVQQELVILIIIYITLGLGVSFIEWVIIPSVLEGQTIGKKLIGIQARRLMPDGSSEPTGGMYATHVLRWIGCALWYIPPLLFIDFFLILATDKRRRFGDFLAGTIVVD